MKNSRMTLKRLVCFMLTLITMLGTFLPGALTVSAAGETVTVKTDGYYTIKNLASGKFLNVWGNSSKNNANITLWEEDHTSGEDFKFINTAPGVYTLTPRCATKRRVNVYGNTSVTGANVCTWTATGHSTQGWVLKSVDGGFILCSANNQNLVLTATGSKNGSNIIIKTYEAGNRSQIWTSSAVSTTASSPAPSEPATQTGITTEQIKAVMQQFGYANGTYWTYPKGGSAKSGYTASNRPGSEYSYNFYNTYQCFGYAGFLMSTVTGVSNVYSGKAPGWKKLSPGKVTDLQVGDIVRAGGHSAVVLEKTKNGYLFTECWGSDDNKIIASGPFNGRKGCNTLKEINQKFGLSYVWRYTPPTN